MMLATRARISVMAWGEKESGESAEKQSSALHGVRSVPRGASPGPFAYFVAAFRHGWAA